MRTFLLLGLLACCSPTHGAPSDNPLSHRYPNGLALAQALRDWEGSSVRFTVAPLFTWKEAVQEGQFDADLTGISGGTITLSPRTMNALHRVAKGSRKSADLQNGVATVLHELNHATGANRNHLAKNLTPAQLRVEETWAEAKAQCDLHVLLARAPKHLK